MDAIFRDIRLALRSLRNRPGFTLTALLTLALGIGASGAIFSVLDAVLLRPPPYRAPEQLVALYERDPSGEGMDGDARFPVAAATFRDWRDQSRSFAAMAAYASADLRLTGGEPERLAGYSVSGNLLQVLGVSPLLGRPLTPDDDQAGAAPTALISYRLWQRRFGGDSAMVGGNVTLNGQGYTVAGVMPPGFRFPDAEADVWVPFRFSEQQWGNRGAHYLNVVARLAPGATGQSALAEMIELTTRINQENPEFPPFGFELRSLTEAQVGDVRPTLLLLAGRFVAGLLYGVTAWDPATLVALTLLLSAIATGASAVPALRATRVAPSNALRAD